MVYYQIKNDNKTDKAQDTQIGVVIDCTVDEFYSHIISEEAWAGYYDIVEPTNKRKVEHKFRGNLVDLTNKEIITQRSGYDLPAWAKRQMAPPPGVLTRRLKDV